MIKRVAIYDMDGTVVNSLHRYKTMPCGTKIDLEYWRANEHKAYDDTLLPLADQYRLDLADPTAYVIIATARVLRNADMLFIKDKLGMPNYIISRKDGDTISGGLLKINGLKKFFNLKNFKNASWVFYEDNLKYLSDVCGYFHINGVFVPSKQGY